ncbi:transcription factor LHW-like isoform X3 [Chenopodium quinoa]|uniref:transcription factor LHW-like isoform X3 n=1 Tax=Chenopodium quinoa TaxID=63459 RepID=UPI000B76BA04|nr:transcription factor LHW-like isoform X3 [Chenopodium quinoa]
METVALRQLLKNLCISSQWSYAVFWKLQQVENYKSLQQPCLSSNPNNSSSQEDIQSFGYEAINICDGVQSLGVGYPIEFAVADMSCCQYLLGEGMVGRVAFAESDFWIYSDDIQSIQLNSNLGAGQYSDDWLLPIAAGIKTTLLAPLLPYGVLQLGSFEKVDENLAVCADIRDRFFTHTYMTNIALPSYADDLLLCSSILMAEPENNDESSFTYNNLQSMEYEDINIIHDAEFIENDFPATYDQLVPLMEDNFLELEEISCIIDDQNMIYPYLNTNIEPITSELLSTDTPYATTMWMFSCHEEDFNDARVSEDLSGGICSDSVHKQVRCPSAVGFRVDHTDCRNLDNFLRDCVLPEEAAEMWMFPRHEEEFDDARVSAKTCVQRCSDSVLRELEFSLTVESGVGLSSSRNLSVFPRDCELQAAILQPDFIMYDEYDYRHSECTNKENVYSQEGFCFSAVESCGLVDERGKQEHLLADVVATSVNNSYDSTSFNRCETSKSSVTSLAETTPDTISVPEECNTMSDNQTMFGMTSAPSLESLESAAVADKQQLERASKLLDDKNLKKPKHSRGKKEKPKSNDRPRPRDRQLIQDRLKVLRKLVPDGTNSSIDGLLDQTAKHMMFLKSVTERAEKMKQFISQEDNVSLEGGNDFKACPIIVKDLEHPSQFQIQMICNDEGAFFEIAEVMHKLKLTILKGAMENRRNKWASFIVEASKGFNKLDIFWPLMRIIQQNGNWMTDQLCP